MSHLKPEERARVWIDRKLPSLSVESPLNPSETLAII